MSLGIGIACITSVGPRMTFASEFDCLAQSLARRLITERGSMSWAPNDGTDMREYLNHGNTPANRFAAARAAKDECMKDERVEDCTVDAQFDAPNKALILTVKVLTASGPFELVASVDNIGISDLSVTS